MGLGFRRWRGSFRIKFRAFRFQYNPPPCNVMVVERPLMRLMMHEHAKVLKFLLGTQG